MNGKGSTRRRCQVSRSEYDDNFERTFGLPDGEICAYCEQASVGGKRFFRDGPGFGPKVRICHLCAELEDAKLWDAISRTTPHKHASDVKSGERWLLKRSKMFDERGLSEATVKVTSVVHANGPRNCCAVVDVQAGPRKGASGVTVPLRLFAERVQDTFVDRWTKTIKDMP